MTAELDAAWLAAHPLPDPHDCTDKNERGRVLVVGGGHAVPGGIRLTGEAALRAGAGKLRLATVSEAAMALGVLVPEAAMTALPANAEGEISPSAAAVILDMAAAFDVVVLGPAMSGCHDTELLVAEIFRQPARLPVVVLDAGALTCSRDLAALIAKCWGRVVLTPHYGEMARLWGCDIDDVAADPAGFAVRTAERFGAVVLLKGTESQLADCHGTLLRFAGGPVGLATGGSGDVLAGIIGGLVARGARPLTAAAWGCSLHARAGEILTQNIGTVGFLARELLTMIPQLLEDRLPNQGKP